MLTLHPKVLVLDEPTSQLDPHSAEEVLDTLVKLNKDLGLTIILSEHRLERVVQHADRILYIEAGAQPLIGEPREVLAEIPLAQHFSQSGTEDKWIFGLLNLCSALWVLAFAAVVRWSGYHFGIPLRLPERSFTEQ